MKNIFLILAILLSLSLLVFQGNSAVRHYSHGQDSQISTLIQNIEYNPAFNTQELLAKQKYSFSFLTHYNNLGTVSILFNNRQYKQANSDVVWFRIKEASSSYWEYQKQYDTNQFNPEQHFTFGFPVFLDSQGKEYLVEIESISGTPDNSISLSTKTKQYIAKYSYSKSHLKNNSQQIPFIVKSKLQTYLSYIPSIDLVRMVLVGIVPLLLHFFVVWNIKIYQKYHDHPVHRHNLDMAYRICTPLVIFLATFLVAGYFSTIGVDPHHDGILLKPALDLSIGKILFKETFTQYGALTTSIQALALSILGKNLVVLKLLTAFFYALISLLSYFIYKRFLPVSILIISLIVWLLMAPYYMWLFLPWSSVYALFFQLLAVYLLILFFEKKSPRYFHLASLSTALVFWCRQPVGVFTFFSIVAYFLYLYFTRQIKKSLLIRYLFDYIIVNVIVMLFFVLILMINNSLVDWYKQSILLAFTFVEDRSQGFSILPVFQSLFPHSISPVSIWVLIPVSTILLQIKNYKNSLLSLTVFVGLASWLQYYPVSGIRHQYWAATPMIPLFCYFVYQLSQQVIVTAYPHKDKLAKYLAIILIILSFLPDISQRLVSGFIKFNTYYEHVDEPSVLKGMKLSAKEQKFFGSIASEITSYLDNNPNSNVVTSGPDALYLTFDPRIRNIHPMYVSWEMVNNSIYPNYNSIFDSYYKNEHPLIILRDNSAPDGYCTLVLEAQYNLMSLAKPCD